MLGFAAFAAMGCGLDVDSSDERSSLGTTLPYGSGHTTFEQFLEQAEVLDDGRLIIDQDILVEDEDAALAYYNREMRWYAQALVDRDGGSGVGAAQQPLTVDSVGGGDNVWPHSRRMEISYCVDAASFGANAALLIQTLEQATYSWSSRIGVSFQRVAVATCNNATENVVFNVRQKGLGTTIAAAFFPDWARASRELLVDPVAFTTTAGGADLLGILGHELGHVLGARHEHIWLVPSCTTEALGAARHVTAYDVDSIMHYPWCRASGGGGLRQSELDYTGMYTLYGMAPALIVSIQ
ncbi:matrixin family metalloprotease [Sorangium sp. So ce118]